MRQDISASVTAARPDGARTVPAAPVSSVQARFKGIRGRSPFRSIGIAAAPVQEIVGRRVQDRGAAIDRRVHEAVLLEGLPSGMDEAGAFAMYLRALEGVLTLLQGLAEEATI